jgi:hypothetical protein
MALYRLSIEGEIQTFEQSDDETLEVIKMELKQFMSHKLEEFLTNENRSGRFSASGKIGGIGLTLE